MNTSMFSPIKLPPSSCGLDNTLCNWILDFLIGGPQAVRISNNTTSTLTLKTSSG
jgi:hypothetical protein